MSPSVRYHARSEGLVVESVGEELLVYDQRTEVAHCLTSAAAAVWRRCQDGADLSELEAEVADREPGDPQTLVLAALAELSEKGLLEAPSRGSAGISRRAALGRLGSAGVAAAALPLIVSAAVPAAAHATSGGTGAPGTPCTINSQCAGDLTCKLGLCCTPSGQVPIYGGCTVFVTQNFCCSGACSTTDTTQCA